jgi:hypothetical protein
MVLIITLVDVMFCGVAMRNGDMPGGVQAILITMTGAVFGGYFGTSWAEDYSRKKFHKEDSNVEEGG